MPVQPKFSLGDRVWYDQNQNGIQDPNEPGYNGATVDLYNNATCSGAPIASTTTGAAGPAGFYQFTDLAAGDYCVQFGNIPAGWSISPADQGDGTNDSSANGNAQIPNISLTADDPNEDMGIYVPGSLGDDVRLRDHGRSAGQHHRQPVRGLRRRRRGRWTGDCHHRDRTATASTSSAAWKWPWPAIPTTQPTTSSRSIPTMPTWERATWPIPPTEYNPPLDSNNPMIPTTTSPSRSRRRCSRLGDRVWYDQNQNGIQDPNEPGYNGATVDLYDNAACSGGPIASTTTGAAGPAGFYQFTDLPAGDYCVQFGNIPAGWSISPADQGDGTNDSSANGNAQIPNISLTADDPNEDMGIYVPGSLGDDVRCVTTGDPLANITVSLFADFNADGVADGPAIATTQSDGNGFYQFSGLQVALAGDPNNTTNYIVQVDTNDADLGTCNVATPPTEYNPPLDSNNPDDPNNDFSFEKPLAAIGDTVWQDNNGNGVQDPGEPGIPGVDRSTCAPARVTDWRLPAPATMSPSVSDVTDANGNYLLHRCWATAVYCADPATRPPCPTAIELTT